MAKYQFKPDIRLGILSVVLIALFISLGIWQLNRADAKRERLAIYKANSSQAAANLQDIRFSAEKPTEDVRDQLMYRKLSVTGKYLSQYLFARDNRQEKGRIGFHVFTPFKVSTNNKVILVNRGWVEMKNHKRVIPDVKTADKEITLSGMAYYLSKPPLELGDKREVSQSRMIVQNINISDLAEDLKLDLYPIVLLLDKNADSGFVRNWKIISAPAEKSTSYAVQWFSFALIIFGLFVGLNIKRVN